VPVNLIDAIAPPSQYPLTSRYHGTAVNTFTAPDGTQIPYISRRLLPDPASFTAIAQYTVVAGDRPDLIAFRLLGDSGQWWQIADANPVLDPRELTATPGQKIRITLPQGITGSA
jgi:nucleoid-associated protein YgaU